MATKFLWGGLFAHLAFPQVAAVGFTIGLIVMGIGVVLLILDK